MALTTAQQAQIDKFKTAYATAQKAGDKKAMEAANAGANKIRSQAGLVAGKDYVAGTGATIPQKVISVPGVGNISVGANSSNGKVVNTPVTPITPITKEVVADAFNSIGYTPSSKVNTGIVGLNTPKVVTDPGANSKEIVVNGKTKDITNTVTSTQVASGKDTEVTLKDGTKVTGTIVNGKTYLPNGDPIPTGSRVTVNGITYEKQADGTGKVLTNAGSSNGGSVDTSDTSIVDPNNQKESKNKVDITKGTKTTVVLADGTSVDGYIVDGKTYLSNGDRIPTGSVVKVGEKFFKLNEDGTSVEVDSKGNPIKAETGVEVPAELKDGDYVTVNGKKLLFSGGKYYDVAAGMVEVDKDGNPIKGDPEEDFLATWMKYAMGGNSSPDYTAEAEAKAEAEKALIQNSLDNIAKQQGLDAEALAQQTEQSRQLLSQKAFQSYLAARQGLANRGLSGSGLAADVNARLGMANNQELANLFTKANTESNQIMKNYNDKLSELKLKKDQITSAKYKTELEKLWQDTQNTMADNLAKIAPYITMTQSQKASAVTAAQNADTNAMNARTKQANTYGFALDASGNPLYDANGNLLMTTSGKAASLAERKWLSEAYGYVMNDDGTFVHDPATGRPITTVEKQKVDAQIKKWADDTSMDLKELEAKVANWTAQNKISLSKAQTSALNASINAAKANNQAASILNTAIDKEIKNKITVAQGRLKTARDIVNKRLTNLQEPSTAELKELSAAQAELNKAIVK